MPGIIEIDKSEDFAQLKFDFTSKKEVQDQWEGPKSLNVQLTLGENQGKE